jgi:hypothetical protein
MYGSSVVLNVKFLHELAGTNGRNFKLTAPAAAWAAGGLPYTILCGKCALTNRVRPEGRVPCRPMHTLSDRPAPRSTLWLATGAK